MKITETSLPGVKIIEPIVYGDHRGWFMETYSDHWFKKAGISICFLQDNHSFSASKGTLRGLHYQLKPKAQAKLVRCTSGAIFDVAVDIQKGSPTFGKWFGIELSAENKKQLFIPSGFAHGFLTLTDNTEVQYKVDQFYAPEFDRGIIWNDPAIGIEWPLDGPPVLSKKDQNSPCLSEMESNFIYGE
ncbi:dTDP-4-dehydrorhamnose 3,5-epimerase [Neobacillus cucumis]|uniref:dTDP-4-dehydrorhamnose 3,5-epimerase n=1 Tax=Neobacillus cucumis TaxID=1740721 RepID=UPI002041213F|nr:dTDP-4-dehydrorhamnose 3,5-epimerase [Neobacillus cucumis]MCM3729753.1 dTDP-4-dehydrorhamnose 3,5-epimerase [Neobacillus cucumis]